MCPGNAGVRSAPDSGFALLLVAIAILALSLIFAAALDTAREHLTSVVDDLTRVQLLAAADGAIATAEYDLAAARAIPPAELAARLRLAIGDAKVELSVRPEASKFDLNTTDLTVLERYFLVSGLDATRTKRLVDEISFRRHADASTGASRYDHRDARVFQTVSELGDLKAAPPELLDCVGDDLTVFTGTSFVDFDHASERVRLALGLPSNSSATVRNRAAIISGRAIMAGEMFAVTARATGPSANDVASRRLIVRITGNDKEPVWTLMQSTPATDAGVSREACERLHALPLSEGAGQ